MASSAAATGLALTDLLWARRMVLVAPVQYDGGRLARVRGIVVEKTRADGSLVVAAVPKHFGVGQAFAVEGRQVA